MSLMTMIEHDYRDIVTNNLIASLLFLLLLWLWLSCTLISKRIMILGLQSEEPEIIVIPISPFVTLNTDVEYTP